MVGVGGFEWSIPACAGEPPRADHRQQRSAVYPRVCGGTVGGRGNGYTLRGLSPRVRGNPSRSTPPLALGRSIPACAGEPPGCPTPCGRRRVYPRVCGGTTQRRREQQDGAGLSPRVRGNRPRAIGPVEVRGSIPACAGEPAYHLYSAIMSTVYPRVCGGTNGTPPEHHRAGGLSPRVRGNL